jgi:hypothetical protein
MQNKFIDDDFQIATRLASYFFWEVNVYGDITVRFPDDTNSITRLVDRQREVPPIQYVLNMTVKWAAKQDPSILHNILIEMERVRKENEKC